MHWCHTNLAVSDASVFYSRDCRLWTKFLYKWFWRTSNQQLTLSKILVPLPVLPKTLKINSADSIINKMVSPPISTINPSCTTISILPLKLYLPHPLPCPSVSACLLLLVNAFASFCSLHTVYLYNKITFNIALHDYLLAGINRKRELRTQIKH